LPFHCKDRAFPTLDQALTVAGRQGQGEDTLADAVEIDVDGGRLLGRLLREPEVQASEGVAKFDVTACLRARL
jgi:hypothetical protein